MKNDWMALTPLLDEGGAPGLAEKNLNILFFKAKLCSSRHMIAAVS